MPRSNFDYDDAFDDQGARREGSTLPVPAIREDVKNILQAPGPVMMKVRKLSIIQAQLSASSKDVMHPAYHGLVTDIDRAMSILIGAPSNL